MFNEVMINCEYILRLEDKSLIIRNSVKTDTELKSISQNVEKIWNKNLKELKRYVKQTKKKNQ